MSFYKTIAMVFCHSNTQVNNYAMILFSLPSVNNLGFFDKIVPMKKWVLDIANEDWAFDIVNED